MKVLQSMRSLSFLLLLCASFRRATCDGAPASPASAGADRSKEGARVDFCWLLVRDAMHADRPGRWVQSQRAATGCPASPGTQGEELSTAQIHMRPMLRAGDVLLVEEISDVLNAHLEATVLEPAFAGAVFRVRLQANGKPVWARAIDSKHAALIGAEKRLP